MERHDAPPEYSPPGVIPPQAGPTTVLIPQPAFGPNPQRVNCPYCHGQILTRVEAESSTKTHIIAALLCLVNCCCLPYLFDSCKSMNHYCSKCDAYLGVYHN